MLTAEQKAIRETGVGSSDVSAIVGVNPWRSALDVFYSKASPGRAPLPVDGDDAPRADAGHGLEDAVARLYARRAGVKLRRSGTLRHRDEPWILATPDRLVVGAKRGLEVKLVGSRVAHHWDNGPPDYVTVQVDWQMLVTGYESWDVAAMLGTDLRVYPIERDAEREELIVEAAREFWIDYVLTNTPPPPANEEERRAYLQRRYPRLSDVTVESTPEVDAIVTRYLAAAKAEEEAAERKLAAANDLLEWLGERRGVRGAWGSASAPLVAGRIDWKGVATKITKGSVDEDLAEKFRGPGQRKLCVHSKRK